MPAPPQSPALWNTRLSALARALGRCGAHGISVSEPRGEGGAPVLALSLSTVRGRELRRAAAHLRALLKETPACLTLRFEEIRSADVRRLRRMLRRLRRFADKISIETETLHGLIVLNAWPFQRRLAAPAGV